MLGEAAALTLSASWAYASNRYAQLSERWGAVHVNFMRAVFAAPMYVAIALIVHGGNVLDGFTLPVCGWVLVSILSSYVIGDNLFFLAAARIGVPTALSIASLYPVWSAIAGVVMLGEAMSASRALGMALSLGGAAWLIRLADSPEKKNKTPVGFLFAALTSVAWALNPVGLTMALRSVSEWQANAVRFSMGAVILLPLAMRATPKVKPDPFGKDRRAFASGLFTDGLIGASAQAISLRHAELAIASTLSSLAPIFAVPIAIALGREKWNVRRALAIGVSAVGIAVLVMGS